jgi:DNA replication protein DnaC
MNTLQAKMKQLNLNGAGITLEQRLKEAVEKKWSYSDLLDMLLSDELEKRENRKFVSRFSKSRLQPDKTLETLDFTFNPNLPVQVIKELSNCNFINKKQNIFILGPSGVGKSHLAQALGHEVCRKGIDVRFYCTYDLFEWLHQGHGDDTHKKKLAEIVKTPLLILDDFGLQSLMESQQEDLYRVISQRYEKSSTIITSNRDISEWPSFFVNPLLGTAALDRLVHRGIQVIIEGESYRLAQFKKSVEKTKKV